MGDTACKRGDATGKKGGNPVAPPRSSSPCMLGSATLLSSATFLPHAESHPFSNWTSPTKLQCRDPGSNRGPLDLQSNALPTELSRHFSCGPCLPYETLATARIVFRTRTRTFQEKEIPQVPPRFELGSLDSESRVLTITPRDQVLLRVDEKLTTLVRSSVRSPSHRRRSFVHKPAAACQTTLWQAFAMR